MNGKASKLLLRVYLLILLCIMVILIVFYAMAYHVSVNIDATVDQHWNNTDFQKQKAATVLRDVRTPPIPLHPSLPYFSFNLRTR